MQTVTAIRPGKGAGSQRSRIYLDGRYRFSLGNRLVTDSALKVGQSLSDEEIDLLTRAERPNLCLNAALRFLTYRARSEHETRERLHQRGFEAAEIDQAVARLKEKGLLDDASFARDWKEDRETFKPRSRIALKLELKHKGVEAGVIERMIEETDEKANACRVAKQKARTLPVSDYRAFREKLAGYLQRRGFDYSATNAAIKEAWQERNADAAESGLEDEIYAGDR